MSEPQIRTWALLRRLIADCLRFRARLAVATVSAAALGLAQLYFTWLVRRWLDGPLITGDHRALAELLLEGTIVMVVSVAAMALSRYLITDVNQRLVASLRQRALERLLHLELASLRKRPTGEIAARFINDAGQLSGFLETIVRRFIREATVGAGALTMLFVLKWPLALATCTLVPLTLLLLLKIGAIIRRWRLLAHGDVGVLGATLIEQLQGVTTVKAYQTERFELRRFTDQHARLTHRILRAELWAAALISLVFFATGVGGLAIVWYGTSQLTSGAMSQAALLAFLLYAGQTVEPLRHLSEIHGFLQGALAAASRVYAVIDFDRTERSDGEELPRVNGALTLDGMTFGYDPDRAVVRDVDLRIGAREQVALVGATGSGKSTIAALLVRFHDPQRGRVLLDGAEIATLRLDTVRRHVCIVEQDPFIFSGPLRENIRYGSWYASTADVERAAHMAGLDPVIARVPGGLDAAISEAGKQLSGGEKQRIALARAIVRNPAVLILDEATSALDGETEAEVFDRLDAWLAERTVIAIGHRFSTVRRFPRAIVLLDGRIGADGPVDVLLAQSAVFVNLFGDQLAGVSTV